MKKRYIFLAIILSVATQAFSQGGIDTNFGFNVQANVPADLRETIATDADTANVDFKYPTMRVRSDATNSIFEWTGSKWVQGGKSYAVAAVSDLSDLDCNPGNWAYVSDIDSWYYCDGGAWAEFQPNNNSQRDVLYVSPGPGPGKKYDINNPYPTILDAVNAKDSTDLVQIMPSNYTYSGPYNADAQLTTITKEGENRIYIPGRADISYINSNVSQTPMFSDTKDSWFGNAVPQDVSIYAPNANLIIDGSTNVTIPIAYYHPETVFKGVFNNIIAGPGRAWGAQTSSKRFELSANKVEVSGDIIFGVNKPIPLFSNPDTTISRFIKFRANTVIYKDSSTSLNRKYGALRIQSAPPSSAFIDSATTVKFDVGRFEDTGTGVFNLFGYSSTDTKNSSFTVSVDDLYSNRNDQDAGLMMFGTEEDVVDTLYNTIIGLEVKKSIGDLSLRLHNDLGSIVRAENSTFYLRMGRMRFDTNSYAGTTAFGSTGDVDIDSSEIVYECEDCVKRNSSPYISITSAFTESDESRFIVKGWWETTTDGPIIDIQNTDIELHLEDFIAKNDGTQPVITSSVPVNVYVSGAFDYGNSPLDPDITFIRLDEFGFPDILTSVDDGNVIYASPNGDDQTAEVGNRNSPFQDVRQAIEDNANDSTVVYFRQGTYDLDTIGTNAYLEWFVDADSSLARVFNTQQAIDQFFYFEPGAKLNNRFKNIPYDEPRPRFFEFGDNGSSDVVDATIILPLKVELTGPASDLVQVQDKEIDLTIIGGELKTKRSFDSNDNYSEVFGFRGRDLFIKFDKIDAEYGNLFYSRDFNPNGSNQNIQVGDFTYTETGDEIGKFAVIVPYGSVSQDTMKELNVNIDLGAAKFTSGDTATINRSGFNFIMGRVDDRGHFKDNNWRVNIDKFILDELPVPADSFSRSGGIGYVFNGSTEAYTGSAKSFVNSNLDLDIGLMSADSMPIGVMIDYRYSQNSKYDINLGKINSRTHDVVLRRMDLNQNSTISVNCNNCTSGNAAIAIIDPAQMDSTSSLIISGTYHSTEDSASVIALDDGIDDGGGKVILKDLVLRNTGNAPAVTSNGPVTVYVAGAFDYGNSPLDTNITFIRLDEFGQKNGIISELPKENVTVDADGNDLSVTNTGSMTLGDANASYDLTDDLANVTDSLIRSFAILEYTGNPADTISNSLGFEEYFTTVSAAMGNRRVVALEITTADTVSTDLYFQISEEDVVSGSSASPNPFSNFVLPQGERSVRYTTADTEIPANGIQFETGNVLYGTVTNGSAAGSSNYIANEGPNSITITFIFVE